MSEKEDNGMIVNKPIPLWYCFYLKCIDDSLMVSRKEKPSNWIKAGENYQAYAIAKSLNSNDACYFIKDMNGNKIEPFSDVPTFKQERFEIIGLQTLN